MLFERFLHSATSTHTYLLADKDTKKSIIIDPVDEHVSKYLDFIKKHGLKLCYALDTHIHADHVTGSGLLRKTTNCDSVIHKKANLSCANINIEDNEMLSFGKLKIKAIFTPGHTDHHTAFLVEDRLFTGDALLINGCGRTDFQGGSATDLWNSVKTRLFNLPGETILYPGHDYNGRYISCIKQEIDLNPRFKYDNIEEFVGFMNKLNLPKPKYMMEAVPANKKCGIKST
jgi:sulfur dioxygenase